MQYRSVGDTGIQVSALGIGTMRFKSRDNAVEIIDRALSLGLTYFDIGSAYSYKEFHENAEAWVGTALAGRDRSSVVLSAKAQPRTGEPQVDKGLGISTRDQMARCIENSLKRVGTDYFDFYQLWDMSAPEHFEAGCVGEDSPLKAMREARQQGLVRHLGFTTHGKPEDIISWLEQVPDFRFITIYYNFNDRYPERVLDYCLAHHVGVCIMGPLRGGLLTGESEIFVEYLPELAGMPVQEIALRFLLGSPAVSTVISGMNEIAHVEQNAAIASLEDPMPADQRARFVEAFREFSKGEDLCTACRYCMGICPEGLPIFQLMGLLQLHEVFHLTTATRQLRGLGGNERANPKKCVACGACVEACPQKLDIPGRMQRLANLIDQLQDT
ncbi:MAG: aldo/keto reductase [Candidatus Zipacnadales bacterium]